MKKRKESLELYLMTIERHRIDPNFYTSKPYLKVLGAECFSNSKMIWVEIEEEMILPPLPIIRGRQLTYNGPVWSSFNNYDLKTKYVKEFLDWEYIYDSDNFMDMSGGKWKAFRRNCRKWPTRNPEHCLSSFATVREREVLLLKWFERKDLPNGVQDAELMADYLLQDHLGVSNMYLYRENELVAINSWDANYKYVNFRMCITKPEEPFLEEFIRYRFYIHPWLIHGRLINDGGVIDSPGLERFKDKMNPVEKRKIYKLVKPN